MDNQESIVIEYLKGLESRVKFLEDTLITLLVALKEGGVIVDDDEEVNDKQYQFNFE
tara:strand:- start:739 stop:909 length:171 start_codon:yes stop_codon:yes gene_type:complete